MHDHDHGTHGPGHGHMHGRERTIITEDDGGPATALIVLGIAALIGFLIWLFVFSGVVFDRGGGDEPAIRIEQRNEQPGVRDEAPAPGTDAGGGDAEQQPATEPS